MDILDVITDYFGVGGLFNPELMEHDKVSNMVEMARAEITSLRAELEIAKKDGERWRYFIETCSSETGFELTGVSDASNEQINEAIDNAMKGNS